VVANERQKEADALAKLETLEKGLSALKVGWLSFFFFFVKRPVVYFSYIFLIGNDELIGSVV
jgi:hypothetical protein